MTREAVGSGRQWLAVVRVGRGWSEERQRRRHSPVLARGGLEWGRVRGLLVPAVTERLTERIESELGR